MERHFRCKAYSHELHVIHIFWMDLDQERWSEITDHSDHSASKEAMNPPGQGLYFPVSLHQVSTKGVSVRCIQSPYGYCKRSPNLIHTTFDVGLCFCLVSVVSVLLIQFDRVIYLYAKMSLFHKKCCTSRKKKTFVLHIGISRPPLYDGPLFLCPRRPTVIWPLIYHNGKMIL